MKVESVQLVKLSLGLQTLFTILLTSRWAGILAHKEVKGISYHDILISQGNFVCGLLLCVQSIFELLKSCLLICVYKPYYIFPLWSSTGNEILRSSCLKPNTNYSRLEKSLTNLF